MNGYSEHLIPESDTSESHDYVDRPRRMSSFMDPSRSAPALVQTDDLPDFVNYTKEESGSALPLDLHASYHLKKQTRPIYSFGWFVGVFVPVILNHLCNSYYIGIPDAIAHHGWVMAATSFLISSLISFGTMSSLCALSTNGDMKDGGCYYLLSRYLGSRIGLAIGVVLIIAHGTAIANRFYILSNTIMSLYGPKWFTSSEYWDRTLLQIMMCVISTLISLPGIKILMWTLVGLFLITSTSIFNVLIGLFTKSGTEFVSKFSFQNLGENAYLGKTDLMTLFVSLGTLFPNGNAVMTAANFIGNLHPAQKAIPRGGFSALFAGFGIVLLTIVIQAATVHFTKVTEFDTFSDSVSLIPRVTLVGFACSLIGSSIALTTGGARIHACLTSDSLPFPVKIRFPTLTLNGESLNGHIMVLLVSVAFSFIHNQTLSLFLTGTIFLIPFSLINLTVYIAESAHYPGFRPTFKYYNKYISLSLSLICIIKMFIMSPLVATLSLAIFIGLSLLPRPPHSNDPTDHHQEPYQKVDSGSVFQSFVFHDTFKEQLALYKVLPHPKTFRPNLLYSTSLNPIESPALPFLHDLLHPSSLACLGQVKIHNHTVTSSVNPFSNPEAILNDFFYDETVASTFSEGVRDLLLEAGIGFLRPNVLALNYPEKWETLNALGESDYREFIDSLQYAFDANFHVIVLRNMELYKPTKDGYIDVWWLSDDGGLTLLLPYLVAKQTGMKLRVMTIAFVEEGDDFVNTQKRMLHLLYKCRVQAEIVTIELRVEKEKVSMMSERRWKAAERAVGIEGKGDMTKRYLLLADLVREYSLGAQLVVLSMLVRREGVDKKMYMAWLEVMSKMTIPFVFVRGNGESALSWET